MTTLALNSLKARIVAGLMPYPAGAALLLFLKRLSVMSFKRLRRQYAWHRYVEQQQRAGHPLKIHFGSHKPVPGWFNTTLHRDSRIEGNLFVDVCEPLPFEDNVADALFHEHLLEHLSPDTVQVFLRECLRILKPSGLLRMGLPNIHFYMQLLAHAEAGTLTEDEQAFIDWYIETLEPLTPHLRHKAPVESVLNGFLYEYGHRFVIPPSLAMTLLQDAGFNDITPVAYGKSSHPSFQGVDRHGDTIQSHRFASMETWCVEARKPEVLN